MRKTVLTLLVFLAVSTAAHPTDLHRRLAEARQLFYDATREEKLVDDAEARYDSIRAEHPEIAGRSEAYLGALQAVRGKHSFLPHNKFIWAMRGLKRLDAGLAAAPDDVEALFIHAAVCHHLPFFFRRGDDALRDFRRILELLPSTHAEYDRQLVIDVFKLIDRSNLTDQELEAARALRDRLGYVEAATDG